MQNVLTLIAGATASLDDSMLGLARETLEGAGATTGNPDWLAEGRVCDIPFEGPPAREASARIRNAFGDLPVDHVAQEAASRHKRLLVADMESTIIDNEMLDELAAELGHGDRVAATTARAMRGEIDFAESLAERVALLAGTDAEILGRLRANIRVNPGARQLTATMRANGGFCALVSGGFSIYTEHVRALVGFDYDQANRLEIVEGKLTGRVVKPILDRHAKQARLLALASELDIPPRETTAVGDGANDLGMILAAGLGVAYRAKPILASAAAMRVDHGDLTALLYAQGYRERQIVEDFPG